MQVNSIRPYQFANTSLLSKKSNNRRLITDVSGEQVQQPSFKGFSGKAVGGLLGAGFAGLCALATMATPVGWIAAATLVASEAGGAVIGGAIGDKITGKDEDDDKEG